jgi:acyl dehydratase
MKEIETVTVIVEEPGKFADLVGQHLGFSSEKLIDQQTIDLFADATGDHQWIHVDPERAAQGPFGRTVAHGYLTLALIPELFTQIVSVQRCTFAVNYGANKVRFPSPVPVGSMLRLGLAVASVEEIGEAVQVVFDASMEIPGSSKPSCVAQTIVRYYR